MNRDKKEFPLVSILVLNHNQTEITGEFLDSARSLTYPNYEILICDMGSIKDPTAQIATRNYPNTKVLRSEVNLGCAGGRNWAVKQARGAYLFLVDNDTKLTPDLLQVLLAPFEQDPSIAVTCPKIRFFHNPDIIQYAGFNPINPFTGRNSAVGSNELDDGQHDVPGYTFSSHGCASMIRKEVFNEVGYFPEKFFFYYEEMDWSARLKKAGYKVFYQPLGLIFHRQSMTLGLKSPQKLYFLTRNRILYMRRNTTRFQFFVFSCFFAVVSLPKGFFTYLLRGQHRHLSHFLRGIFWNLTTSKHSVS